MIEYFCVGSTFCLRKATTVCKLCFRMVCLKHLHHDKPDPTFVYCSKCKKDIELNPFDPNNV
jgi:hypothetical protein